LDITIEQHEKAIRRHHIERLKVKRKQYWGGNNNPKRLGILNNTPKNCSCIGCGNERKYDGETRQELRHTLKQELDLVLTY